MSNKTATVLWFDRNFTKSFRQSALESLKKLLSQNQDSEDFLQDFQYKVLRLDGFASHLASGSKISPKTFAKLAHRQAQNIIYSGAQDAHNRAQTGSKTAREVTLDTTIAPNSSTPFKQVVRKDESGDKVLGTDIIDQDQDTVSDLEKEETYRVMYKAVASLKGLEIPTKHLPNVVYSWCHNEDYEVLSKKIGRTPVRARVLLKNLRDGLQAIGQKHIAIFEVLSEIHKTGLSENKLVIQLISFGLVRPTGTITAEGKYQYTLTKKGSTLFKQTVKEDPTSWIPVMLANESQIPVPTPVTVEEIVEEIVENKVTPFTWAKVLSLFNLTQCFTNYDSDQAKCKVCPLAKRCQEQQKVTPAMADKLFEATKCFTTYDASQSKCQSCPLATHCQTTKLRAKPLLSKIKGKMKRLTGCFTNYQAHTDKCLSCPLAQTCSTNSKGGN